MRGILSRDATLILLDVPVNLLVPLPLLICLLPDFDLIKPWLNGSVFSAAILSRNFLTFGDDASYATFAVLATIEPTTDTGLLTFPAAVDARLKTGTSFKIATMFV